VELCVGFTSHQWQRQLRPKLDRGERDAWEEAIGVFERRLKERFFRCIDALFELDQEANRNEPVRPGFSIMALCCLLIETLQSFYRGGRGTPDTGAHEAPPQPDWKRTTRAFKEFLKTSKHFNVDFHNTQIRGDFAVYFRHAILHEAETRRGWLIEKTVPQGKIIERLNGGYRLNRTSFYEALRCEFQDYLRRLHNESEEELRRNFLKKMDEICESGPKRG